MRDFIYSLMTDRRKEAIFLPVKFLLYLISLAYGAGLVARRLLYRTTIQP